MSFRTAGEESAFKVVITADPSCLGVTNELAGIRGQGAVEHIDINKIIEDMASEDAQVADSARMTLRQIPEQQRLEHLAAALANNDARIRAAAAEALQFWGNADAVGALISALDDPDNRVRLNAAWTLGRIGDASAVGPLVERLGDTDLVVRASACHALGMIGDESAFEAIAAALARYPSDAALDLVLSALDDHHYETRMMAASALGMRATLTGRDEVRTADKLMEILADPHPLVRRMAVSALGSMKWKAALPHLRSLAERDPDLKVRDTARRAIEVIYQAEKDDVAG